MELWVVVVVVGLVLAAVVAVGGLFFSRQRTLHGRVGSFACHLRPEGDAVVGWSAGIAHYGTARLAWWQTFSLAPRPARTWSRSGLTILEREALAETDHSGDPLVVVHCEHGGERFALLLSDGAAAGLVSWLESGPRPVGREI